MVSPEQSVELAIGGQAQAWLELHDTYWKFTGLAGQELDDTARTAMENAAELTLLQMEFYEDDPQTVAQLQDIVDYQPGLSTDPAHQRVEGRRNFLMQLLENTEAHNATINPESIQAKLDLLPAPVLAAGHPTSVVDVARFALRHDFGRSQAPVAQQPTPENTGNTAAPSNNGEGTIPDGERIREPLTIKVYRGDFVLEFPDGSMVSLRRQLGSTSNSAQEEDAIAAFRLKALEHVSQLGTHSRASEIWAACESDVEYSASMWEVRIGDLFEALTYQDRSLVELRKPTPNTKVRYYSLSDFDLSFEYSKESSDLETTWYYAMPDGSLLAPREARLMHLLLKSSAEHGVTREIFDANNVMGDDYQGSKSRPEGALANLISRLRTKLHDTGADAKYIIHTEKNSDKKGSAGRPQAFYWLEIKESLEEEQLALNQAIYDVTELVITHYSVFEDVTQRIINTDKLGKVLKQYENKLPAASLADEDVIEKLKRLTESAVFEQLLNTLSDHDPVFELLEVLGKFVEGSNGTAEVSLEEVILGLQVDAAEIDAADDVVHNVSPLRGIPIDSEPVDEPEPDTNKQDYYQAEIMRRLDAAVEKAAGALIEQLVAQADDRGMLNPSLPPATATVNQLLGTHYPERRGHRKTLVMRDVIFDIVQASPEFQHMERSRGDNFRITTMHGALGSLIDRKIKEQTTKTQAAQRQSAR